MKKFNKIISLLLAVIMILSSLTALLSITAYAEEGDDEISGDEIVLTPTKDPKKDYTEKVYKNEDEKIKTMRLAFRNNGYMIYVDDYSGEVAVVNEKTGEKLFTNPWDVASDKSSDSASEDSTMGSIKEQLLSQIELTFTDITGQSSTYTSFRMAAQRNQIVVKNIKGGIRVEYTIGREEGKMLVPHYIEYERFRKLIYKDVFEGMSGGDAQLYRDMQRFFIEYTAVSRFVCYLDEETMEVTFEYNEDGTKKERPEGEIKKLLEDFPALKDIDVMFTLADGITAPVLERLQGVIKTYCADYSFEELDYDHEMTKYEAEEENPPVFKMALEYTIDENGLSVRLPANGMRFNESLYTLKSLTVLPYMGSGSNWNEGYNFMPDGSGALYDFDEAGVTKAPMTLYSQVYGSDFAYHELSGTYEKVVRYPVFGTVKEYEQLTYTGTNINGDEVVDVVDGMLVDKVNSELTTSYAKKKYPELYTMLSAIITDSSRDVEVVKKKSGFLAIIEEGDALTKIASYHGGNQNDYNSVKMQFTPRPSDTYNLQESMSVSGLGEWTVVSERKYLGNYKMRYVMLSDSEQNSEAYDASWFGMAVAYRDYLYREDENGNSVLKPLSETDKLTSDIPLYIESFGALETVERILSIPVNQMTPLTTFENVEDMYDELSDAGIKNINFKLTGFANGGMYYTAPKNVKFERVVGGKKGFQELLNHANEVTVDDSKLGIFPDFDFAYIISEGAFDGLSLNKHAAKTIDDRYASKRVYSATQQKYINYYDLVISPAYFSEFYEKLVEKYLKYENVNGISVGSLGNALNSDFDEDEPYNREDSKEFTIEAFKYLSENMDGAEIMTSGGNAYTWQYVDHMLDVALDSSRHSRASNSVPFIGVVLHGSIQFAGEPLNMEGDIQYAMLKAIENGASPYFVLSYQNTENLKEDSVLSKYYSIRYDIWKDDLISTYKTLNNVLADVQDKYIINHEFITGERVPDVDEIEADIIDAMDKYIEFEQNKLEELEKEMAMALSEARRDGSIAEQYAIENILKAIEQYKSLEASYNLFFDQTGTDGKVKAGLITEWKNAIAAGNENTIKRAEKRISDRFNVLVGSSYRVARDLEKAVSDYVKLAEEALETVKKNTTNAYIISEAAEKLATVKSYYESDRLINVQPVVTEKSRPLNREVTLIDRAQWVDGMPTYVYGFVADMYVYMAGSVEQGFDFYYRDENGGYERIRDARTLNLVFGFAANSTDKLTSDLPLIRKAIPGTGKLRENGTLVTSNYDVYVNGKLVTAEIYVDDKGYYEKVVDGSGKEQYVYYNVQSSYANVLSDCDALIEHVLSVVEEFAVSTEYTSVIGALNSPEIKGDIFTTLKDKYQAAIDYEKKDDVDNEATENEEVSKYIVDNIVIVTYGTGNDAYKYVILNYNNFTVRVEFGGIEYTIPGYDFVDIMSK